jgi:dTDP-4-dehydrorhamnose reductase
VVWYHLDVKNRSDVFELFDLIKPDIVIHCASIGSVDYTEDHYQSVRDVNVNGSSHVIDAANGYKSKVVYISTNAVYSGKNPPYSENSPLEPVNSYGVIKREAEQLTRSKANKWLIVRPFMLYGWSNVGGRSNWAVKIIYRLEGRKESVKLVDDIIWQPTYAPDCAMAIWKLLFQKELGNEIFNVAGPERATLYEFGLKVCEVFGLESNLLKPVKSEYFSIGKGVLAKRPKDTSYDLLKLSAQGIILSDLKTGLEKMKEAKK